MEHIALQLIAVQLRNCGPEHVASYAPTRSSRGAGLVIPKCLLYEASLVCLVVKKEN